MPASQLKPCRIRFGVRSLTQAARETYAIYIIYKASLTPSLLTLPASQYKISQVITTICTLISLNITLLIRSDIIKTAGGGAGAHQPDIIELPVEDPHGVGPTALQTPPQPYGPLVGYCLLQLSHISPLPEDPAPPPQPGAILKDSSISRLQNRAHQHEVYVNDTNGCISV